MASSMMEYPPFSAPATLERRHHRTWSDWFSNAKSAFMRPWRQRHRRSRGQTNPPTSQRPGIPQGPHSLTSFDGYPSNATQGFPDFSSRLSPLGGRPQSKGKKTGEDFTDSTMETDNIKIPENPAPSRPPLSNIFPMSSKVVPPKRGATSSSSSSHKAIDQRRHSTPVTPLSQSIPTLGERRASASSDTSADKPRHGRRERRASATRELPLLPKRGSDPLTPTTPPNDHTPQFDEPQISPYSEFNGLPNHSSPSHITMNFGPVRHSPVGAPSGGFSYPPVWPQPCHQLKELEEELEEDGEGDGEEEEAKMISEEWESFRQAGDEVPSFTQDALPVSHMGPAGILPPGNAEPAQTKGALGKILRLVSSSKRKPDNAAHVPVAEKGMPKGAVPKGLLPKEEESDTEVKGFDNFFLY